MKRIIFSVRLAKTIIKRIKQAALDADKTIEDFLNTFFDKHLK